MRQRTALGPTVVVVTLVLGALVLLGAARLVAARQALADGRASLHSARDAMVTRRDAVARDALARAHGQITAARRHARQFPLGLVRPVPVLGSPGRASEAAATAGLEALRAAQILVAASKDFPTAGHAAIDGHALSGFHAAALRSRDALARARIHLRAAKRAVHRPAGAFIPQISRPARSLKRDIEAMTVALGRAEDGLALVAELTADGADVRLLLLNQDTLELRPTGGYIGSYGVLRFRNGTVSLEKFDATESLPPPNPPLPAPPDLAPSLPGAWRLSNSNWWPDFPTTARAARELFRRHGGGEVDGVVAITEAVTARLIGAVGPLSLPSYKEPVVEKGFAERAVYEVELKRPLDQPRKKFLIELGEVLFSRLLALPPERVPRVADALDDAAASGDVQLWFADPGRQSRIDPTVLAGRLPLTNGDFLMLVDANLSASKANLGLVKDVTYRVRRDRDGWLRADLRVRVRNGAPESAINPYYNGFLRVYVPLGARRVGAGNSKRQRAPDGPYQVFSKVLDVLPLKEQVVTFEYRLPPSVAPGGRYSLVWARQPGTHRDSLTVDLGDDGRFHLHPDRRSLRAAASFRDHPLTEFLRSRWIIRRLGLLQDG